MNFNWRSEGKERVKGLIGTLFLISLITSATSLLDLFLELIQDPRIAFVVAIIVLIVQTLVQPAFVLSNAYVYLRVARGEYIDVGHAFFGFSNFRKALVLNLLMGIYIFLWSLLFIIPGIIKSYAYSFSFFILADNPDLSVFEIIDLSKDFTNGYKGKLFLLDLSYIWLYIISIFALGIPIIWLAPRHEAARAVAYDDLCFGIPEDEMVKA